jgi:uncharacterized protein YoxC
MMEYLNSPPESASEKVKAFFASEAVKFTLALIVVALVALGSFQVGKVAGVLKVNSQLTEVKKELDDVRGNLGSKLSDTAKQLELQKRTAADVKSKAEAAEELAARLNKKVKDYEKDVAKRRSGACTIDRNDERWLQRIQR